MSFNIGKIIASIDKVPDIWIYRHYYRMNAKDDASKNSINQPFDGRIIKVRSLFNRDSNPSLCFYYKNGSYLWQDFSAGKGGDSVDFVAYIYNKFRKPTEEQIILAYENFLETGGLLEEQPQIEILKYDYHLYCTTFDNRSLNFWKSYKIKLETLNKFDVRFIHHYALTSDKGTRDFYNNYSFAYYSKKGPYQIYQPEEMNGGNTSKYITIDSSYLIGENQLKFNKPYCAIVSGLKDLMAVDQLDLNFECVASTSESTLLSLSKINILKSKYKKVFTILDNDLTGIKSMQRYLKVYDIPYVRMNLLKDLALNSKTHDEKFLKEYYAKVINSKINEEQ